MIRSCGLFCNQTGTRIAKVKTSIPNLYYSTSSTSTSASSSRSITTTLSTPSTSTSTSTHIRRFHSSSSTSNSNKSATNHSDSDSPGTSPPRNATANTPSNQSSLPSTLLHQVSLFRSALSASLAPSTEKAKGKLDEAAKRWNQLSGYGDILELKREVQLLESRLTQLRHSQAQARSDYLSSISQRSQSQSRITDLLSRKHLWSDSDLSDYTNLLRSEHSENRDSKEAEKRYEESEEKTLRAWDELVRKTLERYHQEMSWSDKIRWAGTLGSWTVLGVNVLVFILAIFLVEPYKRKKLAKTFETRLLEGEAHSSALIQETVKSLQEEIGNLRKDLGFESDITSTNSSLSSNHQSEHFKEEYISTTNGVEQVVDEYRSEIEAEISSPNGNGNGNVELGSGSPSSSSNEITFDQEDSITSGSNLESWKKSSSRFLRRLSHSLTSLIIPSSSTSSSSSSEPQDGISQKEKKNSVLDRDRSNTSQSPNQAEVYEALRTSRMLGKDFKGLEEREKDIIVAGGIALVLGGLLVTLLKTMRSR